MVDTIKFSQMTAGGDLTAGDKTPGLLNSMNVLFNNPWTFLAPGSTASRPVPSPAVNGRLRFNTDSLVYEYYDTIVSMWVELSGSGTGTVNPGTANSIAFYAANGTAVSPTNSANLAVLVTSVSGFPSLSTTLPTGLSIPSATITASTAALTAGQVLATPVNPTDIANKAYVDASFGVGVTSITGTTNQVIASSPTGAVTLSLPQDIATGSTPTFAGLTLTSIPLNLSSGGTNNSLTASAGGIVWSDASKLNILSGTATAGQLLQSGSSTTPAWSTSTYPSTNAINTLLYASSANVMAALATANNGVLITSNSGVPSWLANSGTAGFVLTANSGAPPSWQNIQADGAITSVNGDSGSITPSTGVITINGGSTGLTTSGTGSTLSLTGTLNVSHGGSGLASATAYAVLCGGTTSTGAFQSIASVGTAGQVLTSNGAGALPTMQTLSATGGLKSFQIFTSGTAATYTRPAGITSILVEVLGGGGAGGGALGAASSYAAGGGGGSGGYARLYVPSAASTYTYTVGAGGTAGTAGNNAGNAGGTTTFSASSLQATGGSGGSGSGGGIAAAATPAAGGAAGVGSNGNFNPSGKPGLYGLAVTGSLISGAGGSSIYGGGALPIVAAIGTGNNANNYGSGGSGGTATTVSVAGGTGSAGIIIIWEFA